MPDEDRHGFVAAFVGGVRREGDRGGSGKRLLAVAAGVVAAVALGAVVVGALGTRGAAADGTKHTEATAAKANPSAPAGRPGAPGTTAPGHPGHPGRPGGTQDLGNFGGGATTPNAPAQGGTSDAKHAPGAGSGAGTSTAPDDPAGSGATNTVRHDSLVKQVTYSAVAGYGCTDSSTHFYAKDADFGQGTSGWLRSSTGGYGGCGDGTYLAEPMSGSNGSYDHSQGVLWRFRYSSQPSAAMCRVSVYVPDNSDIKYVGGNPTHYFLYGDDYTFGRDVQPIGDFTISQVANRGGWVTPDAFEVTSGTVVLTMVNTGVDYTSATRHAHHAAAPVRLSCTQA
ncbi:MULTISPECIES: hypothetical protein [Streptomycetaceae]|uniref:hypothetical protein n=1 Tax=Streptomycetaceae TaxID=2062 RepID=UPI0002D4503A|nr:MULTISPECIES: hypothetical protein [Streptomycetaceae]MYS59313.1 hypothetical protein [Streptomyces sp. SID5468]